VFDELLVGGVAFDGVRDGPGGVDGDLLNAGGGFLLEDRVGVGRIAAVPRPGERVPRRSPRGETAGTPLGMR
jgi:hypothetical protein